MSNEPIAADVKSATYDIVFLAMIETYKALNACTVLVEMSTHEEILEAADQIMQSLQHLASAGRHIERLPVMEVGE